MERQPCVYMLASKRNGTLYTGVTSNLLKRVWEHKNNLIESFTSKYGVHTLVWKLKVIEKMNSNWHDLYSDLL
jgi:putative endonuclease